MLKFDTPTQYQSYAVAAGVSSALAIASYCFLWQHKGRRSLLLDSQDKDWKTD
jgi:hypothetical protein